MEEYKTFNALAATMNPDFSEYVKDGVFDARKAIECHIAILADAVRMPRYIAHSNGDECQHCEAVDDLLELIHDGLQKALTAIEKGDKLAEKQAARRPRKVA